MSNPLSGEPSVGYLVHQVAKAFRRKFEDIAKGHGLTLPQWRVLAELVRQDGVSQVTLAGAVDADPMTLKDFVERVGRRALVRRQQPPADSRAKVVHLSAEGRALFGAAKAVGVEVYRHAVEGLSEAELAALAASLTHVRNNLTGAAAPAKEVL